MMKKSGSMTEYTMITLSGRSCDSSEEILTTSMAIQLRKYLPPIYRLASTWKLIYASSMDGFSLKTLYRKSKDTGPGILVIKSIDDSTFGAYCSDELGVRPNHYGSNACFLWKQITSLPLKLEVYPATNLESIYLFSDPTFLAIGCGNGKFGLWIDGNLEFGVSTKIPVFNNEVLSSSPDGEFICYSVELWSPIL